MVSGESASGIQFGMALTGERNAMDANEHARKGASLRQELKPCPFCGEIKCDIREGGRVAWATCPKCGCTLPLSRSKAEAIAAWNKRSVETGG